MIDDDFVRVDSGTGPRRIRLGDYLDSEAETRAIAGEYAWIKRLRHLNVDGQPMRRRFTFRGDSLWWFTELYLHKQQVVLTLFRAIAALRADDRAGTPDSPRRQRVGRDRPRSRAPRRRPAPHRCAWQPGIPSGRVATRAHGSARGRAAVGRARVALAAWRRAAAAVTGRDRGVRAPRILARGLAGRERRVLHRSGAAGARAARSQRCAVRRNRPGRKLPCAALVARAAAPEASCLRRPDRSAGTAARVAGFG